MVYKDFGAGLYSFDVNRIRYYTLLTINSKIYILKNISLNLSEVIAVNGS